MALLVTTVAVETRDGDSLTSFWIELELKILERDADGTDNPHIEVELFPYRSETDRANGKRTLQMYDSGGNLASDVPPYLRSWSKDITPAEYASLNVSTLTDVVRDTLEQGKDYADWTTFFPNDPQWVGFGVGKVALDMPA